jgi:tyrosyl-tRNA synthetase
MKNVLDILKERGLLENVTSPDVHKFVESPVTVYAGFDPSSDSLQAGNFVTIMVLAHFQRCGHKVIALVGGATGMIGDPSGKSSERNLLSDEEVKRNTVGIRENLSRFLDFGHTTAPAIMVNNADWFWDFSFIGFLRDVGKHFRMGVMLGKESVKKRLDSDAGMSYAEFSYQLLQAYDFLKLNEMHGCRLQVGGSDQWGNITAGTDLIRKIRATEAYGAITPLICDSAGQKFGKSEGNAVYLDARKTSCYDFYQFFFRTADADVIKYLKVFTFLPLEEISALEEQVRKAPEARAAQKKLAEEITRTVHGEEGLKIAGRASAVLFGESMEGLHAADLLGIFANVPSKELPRSQVEGAGVLDVAVASGLCASKGEARRLVESGGLNINNRRVEGIQSKVAASDIIDSRLLVLRSGKKTFHLVRVV